MFGDDFDTPDGTCVRDYIHVTDLCAAHMAALDRLASDAVAGTEASNLGNGNGFSVREVIDACRRVTGVDIRYRISGRRPGDPATLVGAADRARDVLNWRPVYADLEVIIETAWRWMNKGTGPDKDG